MERIAYPAGLAKTISLPIEGSITTAVSDPRLEGVYMQLAGWTKARRIHSYLPRLGVTDTKLQSVGPFNAPRHCVHRSHRHELGRDESSVLDYLQTRNRSRW